MRTFERTDAWPLLMEHLLAAKTVVGTGEGAIVLELKGRAIRIKRRGMPELFLPLESAGEVGRFLLQAAAPPLVRA